MISQVNQLSLRHREFMVYNLQGILPSFTCTLLYTATCTYIPTICTLLKKMEKMY